MQHRNDYEQTHPPSDDKSKVAILWDQRHDCEKSIAEIYNRIRELEKGMTKFEVLRESGARTTAWVASLSTGIIVAVFVFLLNYYKK